MPPATPRELPAWCSTAGRAEAEHLHSGNLTASPKRDPPGSRGLPAFCTFCAIDQHFSAIPRLDTGCQKRIIKTDRSDQYVQISRAESGSGQRLPGWVKMVADNSKFGGEYLVASDPTADRPYPWLSPGASRRYGLSNSKRSSPTGANCVDAIEFSSSRPLPLVTREANAAG